MTSKAVVEGFLAQRTLAVVGASRARRKFGNFAFKALKARGYRLFPINPHAENIEGEHCYPNLTSLPEPVDGVLVVVPPTETEQVVREAARAGISRVWIQQGAESEAAIRFCEESGMSVVHGECILMFAPPVTSFHRFHRWIWRILGKLPR